MNRTEKMDFLIHELGKEKQRYADMSIPSEESEKWQLLRSLMNIRQPGPAGEEFLRVQDELLSELTQEKGIVDVDSLPTVPGDPKLALWQGDITTLNADAIVNAANSAMLGCFQPCHGCIDNAIHTYAGIQLRNECDELMKRQGHEEPTGDAKITAGYNLPCKYVLHTVGPIISGLIVTKEDDRLLESCYRSCLSLAAEHGVQSIAFCCISTGVFRFPKERAAKIAVRTVRDYLASDTRIKKVVFNVFTEEDRAIYQRILG